MEQFEKDEQEYYQLTSVLLYQHIAKQLMGQPILSLPSQRAHSPMEIAPVFSRFYFNSKYRGTS